jgi:hypothetical protein
MGETLMPMMTPQGNPYAFIQDGVMHVDGVGMGQMTIKSPSGNDIFLTEAEERDVAKRALEERLILELNRDVTRKESLAGAMMNAVPWGIGIALGYALVTAIVGKIKKG